MKKYLGDILLEKGYISSQDLTRGLARQMQTVLGDESGALTATGFLLDVARTKYNNRDQFYLGKILTEMKLLQESQVQEALAIQKAAPPDAAKGRMAALNRIIVRMNSSYNLIDLLNQILVLAAQLVEAESASLTVYDHARDTLVILMPTGPGADAVRDLDVPRDKGFVGWVYRNGRPVICNDTSKDERFYAAIDAASGYTSRQILCVPLSVKNGTLGAIEAINKKAPAGKAERGFTTADQFLLEMFSAQAGIAIENTRLAVALSQAEEDLTVHSTDVLAAQRAHAGALVAGSMLHELERSIIPLQGYAARLSEISGDERVEKYRTYIDREMDRLISHASDVARYLTDGFAPVRRPVSLRELLRELEAMLWVDCRTYGIGFSTDMPDDARVGVDKALMLSSLEKLFRNSRDAMPEGGSFSLKVRRGSAGRAVIEVADTGKGIQTDPVERIFEPFFTSGTAHGAGLGLPIARRIIELHGGSISAANRPDQRGGALVTVTLPVI